MAQDKVTSPEEIRALRAENSTARARDFCDSHDISEAQLVASQVGQGVTRVAAHPDQLMPQIERLGEVMALTRNASCVHERVGHYGNYRSGPHAAMILQPEIDLRLFPSHWTSAFALESETETGFKRSIQVFDAAGDAVHKIHLRETSNHDAWAEVVATLATGDLSDQQTVAERKPPEAPKANLEKLDVLRTEWARMTDTHQFMRLTSKLRMNRLGAYRHVGEPFVQPLETGAVDAALQAVAGTGTEIMIFVGNKGCIQIHGGPIEHLRAMGPWQNVMDPRFNLHLRLDHIAEVYAVTKPTQRGPAVSVEAFDAEGSIILQIFGRKTDAQDSRPAWEEVVAALPHSPVEALV
ncbi:hemin-degrading factor [Tritonibacter horizontis]|uniref:Hemin transport protein HemS n=1 Tax=Tritonibacter horizontis TaxID=1768241 RepID=A0A132BW58_9RHOB|nr:ChuX/HutX family heme-like substrate-binding protein [Tritonibacter horizontis]KUP91960.1 hemin transport protein HemS [Tritonibacter horizontis]